MEPHSYDNLHDRKSNHRGILGRSEGGAEVSLSDDLREACRNGGVCDEDCLVLEAADRIEKLEAALKRIRDCPWPGPLQTIRNRADLMQQIAKEALE